MSVTRFTDTIIPGGQPAAANPDDQPAAPLSPFESEHPRPSHNDLLRTSLAISERLTAAKESGAV